MDLPGAGVSDKALFTETRGNPAGPSKRLGSGLAWVHPERQLTKIRKKTRVIRETQIPTITSMQLARASAYCTATVLSLASAREIPASQSAMRPTLSSFISNAKPDFTSE